MKTIPVSLIVAGVITPMAVMAEPGGQAGGGGGGGRGGPHPCMEAWKAADRDGDGAISKEEFEAMPRIQNIPAEKRAILFQRLDKNGDGKLDREELGMMMRMHGEGAPMKRLWELDTDKSGGVSFEEFKAGQFFSKLDPERQKEVFKRLDTNGDGVISPNDRPEPPFKRDDDKIRPPRPDGGESHAFRMDLRRIIRELDQNQDGSLSIEEFKAGPAVRNLTEDEQKKRFEMLDKNHDQKISPEDFPRMNGGDAGPRPDRGAQPDHAEKGP